ncbi:unnamed protein product [Prunus armeniaca]|uniref:MADS-box domain-containing protein n=1 Tax=Prunus armeniaca TaxID=36596 RepID=A0A6J5X0U8_PRUAR|nr:hypothetical protein GBA52_025550 [Prunus armeniaca]CAB4305815.1 unnamed protein product [Prunus armeniaca]
MGRRKTKLALELIQDDKARKITFRKRKNGLFKKAFELTTLCDVKVCTIVYEKKSEGKLAPPQTFPAKFEEVKEIIDKYKSNSSKIKKVQNLADFYATQTMQVKKEIVKLRTKSYEEKYPTWDNRLNEYSLEQMHELLNNLEAKIQAAHKIHNMMMIDSKKPAIQDYIPPMDMVQSNLDPPFLSMVDDQNPSNYGSMGMSENGWDQSASASTSWANNNIQYAPSNVSDYKGTTSIWDYDLFGIDAVPLQYGNMEEKPTFYNNNPMQPPYTYDPILSSAATTSQVEQQQQLSVEHPLDVPPINVAYDEPLSLSLQPSYTDCPVSAASFSFEYQQFATSSQTESESQTYVDDQVRMLYDSMFQFKQNNVSTYK